MMSVVLAFPPKLSWRTRVNLESRYGMNGFWNGGTEDWKPLVLESDLN